ncbi:MAG: family 10 glycosylhydrolase, partial [Muribaculaceae bacterium]|nr:family 10 glycosylhydrolase [Muribaculaceae bacterium]
RYESSANAWGNSDYRADHPDWIMTYNSKTILNPGMEEVQQRIVDVCKEIITNYDVDGIVFDDYFYLQGTPESYDSDLYAASGTSLSQADWRRENVNTMVRKVWNMIQSTKPYVKFGIGPAGVSDKAASDYGLSDCTGNDWQYDGLYSNPLAWLGEGTIDFITPQIYWRNSNSTNPYDPIAEWWSDACANTFGRHFYSSQDLAWLSSNNSSTYWAETAAQVQTNRDATGNDAPGCVFFDTRYFTGIGDGGVEGVAEYLYENKFQNPALPPVLTWKNNYSTDPGPVTNLALTGTTLSWTGYDNMRYAVYAVPTGTSTEGEISSDYLLGNPYETTFDVSGYTSGYTLGVSVVDRYGYEFAVTWLGGDAVIEQLATPTLTSPADGTTTAETFDFTWSAIDGATYTLEISTSATFATTNFSKTSTTNSLASSSFNLAASTTYYWRVKAAKTGYISSTSATQSFTTAADESSSTGGDTSNLTKDPATYSAVGDYTVENLWIYSSATSNFPSNLTTDTKQRSMTTLNGNIYVAQNDGYILVFNGTTGEYTKTITLTGDCKTTSSGTALSYPS